MTNPDFAGDMTFNLLKSSSAAGSAIRLGRLIIPHRKPVDTPNYFAIASRGAIPHMTPDVVNKHTQLTGAYMALEDFIEKSVKRVSPAIFNATEDGSRPLHAYTAMPNGIVTIMGARRHPAVVAPMGNGSKYISICTSTGFQNLGTERYGDAIALIKPDIVIPLADLTYSPGIPSSKRQLRMVERTEEWLDEFFNTLDPEEILKPAGIHTFAPLLPVTYSLQWEYLNRLSEDHSGRLQGLAVYDVDILADLEHHPALSSLPRLSMDPPSSPHQILRHIRMGADIFSIPFVNSTSDSGVAFTFSFPPHLIQSPGTQVLGLNMWSEEHRISLIPLVENCDCYACTKHHRAYLHHLLSAREMLAWVLLQVHNHHVMAGFFASIRAAITDGSFEEKAEEFAKVYDPEIPTGTGERPRARGYHFKSEAGQQKINPTTWREYERDNGPDTIQAIKAASQSVVTSLLGGAEAPLVPATADILDEKDFAEIDNST